MSNSNTIEISIETSASVTQIWSVLTELEHMKKWFFEVIPEFSATEGFYTEFEIAHENRNFRHCWRVLKVVAQSHYTVEWTFTGLPGRGHVTHKITPGPDDKNTITFIDTIVEPFDTSIPEFKRQSSVDGWTYIMNEMLGPYLEEIRKA